MNVQDGKKRVLQPTDEKSSTREFWALLISTYRYSIVKQFQNHMVQLDSLRIGV